MSQSASLPCPKLRMRLLLVVALVGFVGCSGTGPADGGGPADSGVSADAGGGVDAGGGADGGLSDAGQPDAGPQDAGCAPVGTWRLTYVVLDGGAPCVAATDTLRVQPSDGGLVFSVDSIGPQQELCGTGSMLVNPTVTATFDPLSCRLQFEAFIAYCYSGETQCHRRALDVSLRGDAVSGTGVLGKCWCSTVGESRFAVAVSGARQ